MRCPIRVLVAEDHELLLDSLCAVIAGQSGLELTGRTRRSDVLIQLTAQQVPDVLCLDADLPHQGLDCIPALQAVAPPPRIAVVSRRPNDAVVGAAVHRGAIGFLGATATPEHVVACLHALSRDRPYISPKEDPATLEAWGDHWRRGRPRSSQRVSPRELQVLRLLPEGLTNKEIALRLAISEKSVETYRRRLELKLSVKGRSALVEYASRAGLLSRPRLSS